MRPPPLLHASLLVLAVASAAAAGPRERTSLDAGWRFTRGDAPDAGGSLSYEALKPWILPTGDGLLDLAPERPAPPAGGPPQSVSYAQAAFDDGAWAQVDVPHDWAIEGPFRQDLPG